MSTLAEQDTKTAPSDTKGNGSSAAKTHASKESGHQFQEPMGSHPLWHEYLAELEASRQADVAKSNRLADLEIGL